MSFQVDSINVPIISALSVSMRIASMKVRKLEQIVQ